MDFEEILRLAVVLADSDSEGEINDEEGEVMVICLPAMYMRNVLMRRVSLFK